MSGYKVHYLNVCPNPIFPQPPVIFRADSADLQGVGDTAGLLAGQLYLHAVPGLLKQLIPGPPTRDWGVSLAASRSFLFLHNRTSGHLAADRALPELTCPKLH